MNAFRTLVVIAGAAVALLSTPAHAAFSVDASNYGSYRSDGARGPYNYNFATGNAGVGNTAATSGNRSFFLFDLSSLSGTVTSATLHLWDSTPTPAPPNYLGYNSLDTTETLNIYDVSSALSNFAIGFGTNANDAGGISTFGDLGTGTVLGTVTVTKAGSGVGSYVDVSFNSAGLSALQGALGGKIVFGGALGSLSGNTALDELMFSGWSNNGAANVCGTTLCPDGTHVQLQLEGVSAVPLPAAFWLLGSALASAGCFARRRRAAATV